MNDHEKMLYVANHRIQNLKEQIEDFEKIVAMLLTTVFYFALCVWGVHWFISFSASYFVVSIGYLKYAVRPHSKWRNDDYINYSLLQQQIENDLKRGKENE